MPRRKRIPPPDADCPLWYKDAIIYELRVTAFHDSNDDGSGDFRGLTAKLDYLVDLGVTAVWLLPFYPSPMKDDGYDISDYTDIRPDCGTLADFKVFLREAHRRGLKVITELVLNHTSDRHPWFEKARRAPVGSRARDFYVWSDDPERYKDTRIIFKDFETSNWAWDHEAKAYYWHRFYSHQPDLNFDNPAVRKALLKVMDFWLELGVDGLRLDAVPYLFEREGTNCENLPETHEYLKVLRKHIDRNHKDKMLLAEANQWPEDAISYFGEGDECHMAFNFPIMPRLFMAIHMEDRFPIVDILQQTPPLPPSCQWAIFLRNHDELTLEMVTDEERDYMYRVYANDATARINLGIRRRLAPLLGNSRRKIELMNGLLFSLPGTPVLYYGDEIGMGDNIYLGDRNGVRTPMQWSADRNAGFSSSNPQRLFLPINIDPEYHYETVNVAAHQNNPSSLLWWMKRLIALRKRFQAFGQGTLEMVEAKNPKVLAYIRSYGEERILVVANLSRFVQYVELDLSAYDGVVPVELFGLTSFPPIGKLTYLLTLGPHAFYWFSLDKKGENAGDSPEASIPFLETNGSLTEFLKSPKGNLEKVLARFIRQAQWFTGTGRHLKTARIVEVIPLASGADLCIISIQYEQGDPEDYLLPLAFASGDYAEELRRTQSHAVVAELRCREGDGILYDGAVNDTFWRNLLAAVTGRKRLKGSLGEARGTATTAARKLHGAHEGLEAAPWRSDRGASFFVFGQKWILKLYRRLGEGTHPDLEVCRFLDGKAGFTQTPSLAGTLDFHGDKGPDHSLAILQEFVPSESDARTHALANLRLFLDDAKTKPGGSTPADPRAEGLSLFELAAQQSTAAHDIIGPYWESAALIGKRVAELHGAFASDDKDPVFRPEAANRLSQRSLYQSMRNLTGRTMERLRRKLARVPERYRETTKKVIALEPRIMKSFRGLIDIKSPGFRIRHHGDLHLGQILFTGKDFIIGDFEGEPGRPFSERRMRASPLRDLAAVIRSFEYVAHTAMEQQKLGALPPESVASLWAWADYWKIWVSAAFLRGYLTASEGQNLLPRSLADRQALLDIYLLEKAVYELGYEIDNRPELITVPLTALQRTFMDSSGSGRASSPHA